MCVYKWGSCSRGGQHECGLQQGHKTRAQSPIHNHQCHKCSTTTNV